MHRFFPRPQRSIKINFQGPITIPKDGAENILAAKYRAKQDDNITNLQIEQSMIRTLGTQYGVEPYQIVVRIEDHLELFFYPKNEVPDALAAEEQAVKAFMEELHRKYPESVECFNDNWDEPTKCNFVGKAFEKFMNAWIEENFMKIKPYMDMESTTAEALVFQDSAARYIALTPLHDEFFNTLNRHGANLSEEYKATLLKRFHEYLDAYDFDEKIEVSMSGLGM